MRFLIATGNPGKLRDFQGMEPEIAVELLPGFAALPSVEEDGDSFAANARKKAEFYSRFTELPVLADDSGLVVDALNGEPGIYSARYSGGTDEDNNRLVLEKMRGVPWEQRTARFICVLAVARKGKTLATFEGATEGRLLDAPRGAHGFGYDPLFFSTEANIGFAEIPASEKARYSHRGKAARQLLAWARSAGQQ